MKFQELYGYIREKFPPARAVAFLVPLGAPVVAAINTWILNELPFIAEYVNDEWLAGVWAVSVAAIVGLAFKWLDGRAKWEEAQVGAQVEIAKATLSPTAVARMAPAVEQAVTEGAAAPPEADAAFELSQPDEEPHPDDLASEDELTETDVIAQGDAPEQHPGPPGPPDPPRPPRHRPVA